MVQSQLDVPSCRWDEHETRAGFSWFEYVTLAEGFFSLSSFSFRRSFDGGLGRPGPGRTLGLVPKRNLCRVYECTLLRAAVLRTVSLLTVYLYSTKTCGKEVSGGMRKEERRTTPDCTWGSELSSAAKRRRAIPPPRSPFSQKTKMFQNSFTRPRVGHGLRVVERVRPLLRQ